MLDDDFIDSLKWFMKDGMECPEQEGFWVGCKTCKDTCPIFCSYSDSCRTLSSGLCNNINKCRINQIRYFFSFSHIRDWLWDLHHTRKLWIP